MFFEKSVARDRENLGTRGAGFPNEKHIRARALWHTWILPQSNVFLRRKCSSTRAHAYTRMILKQRERWSRWYIAKPGQRSSNVTHKPSLLPIYSTSATHQERALRGDKHRQEHTLLGKVFHSCYKMAPSRETRRSRKNWIFLLPILVDAFRDIWQKHFFRCVID